MPTKKIQDKNVTLPETNSSPLKMDGWNTILSYWVSAYFQGLLPLVLGRVGSKESTFRVGATRKECHFRETNLYEPRKKPSYFPLYWMVNRDPYNSLL